MAAIGDAPECLWLFIFLGLKFLLPLDKPELRGRRQYDLTAAGSGSSASALFDSPQRAIDSC
jgi:hypothetical protein